jgi:Leucine-rich repeat (LRR) protein
LDLRENSVAELPPSLAGLPRLRQIDLRSNRLSRLPDWLTLMPSLEKLDLRWNEIDPSLPLLAELDRQGCVVLT